MIGADRYAWTEAGPHSVAPGVHRIPCPLPNDGLRAVNVYAIEQGSGLALIDAGWRAPATMAALEAGLQGLGAAITDVTTVICTHVHYDHYGLAGHIRDAAGAPVALGRIERAALDAALDRDAHLRWLSERDAYLRAHGAEALVARMEAQRSEETFDSIRGRFEAWVIPDRLVEDGDRIELDERVLVAHLTPGHTRGHLVFHDEANDLLFAGDHVLPHITPSLGFEPAIDGKALERFLAGLQRVRDLPATCVLPGHGPVFNDLAGRVDELLAHHDQRLARCLEIVERGGIESSASVAAELPWTRRERAFAELDAFNQMLAVTETATHLELLADRGGLQRSVGRDVRYTQI